MFADDSSLDSSGKTVKEIEVTLQKSLNDAFGWCKNNLMCLYPEKKTTKCMVIATRQKHQRSPLRLKLDHQHQQPLAVGERGVGGGGEGGAVGAPQMF